MAAKRKNHGEPIRLRALLCTWVRLLVAVIAIGALSASSPTLALAATPTPGNSPLGPGRNPASDLVGAEQPQAPESSRKNTLAGADLESDKRLVHTVAPGPHHGAGWPLSPKPTGYLEILHHRAREIGEGFLGDSVWLFANDPRDFRSARLTRGASFGKRFVARLTRLSTVIPCT